MGENGTSPADPRRPPQAAAILDCVPDPVFCWDVAAERLDYCNGAWQEVLGWSASDLQGLGSDLPCRLIHADDYDKVERAVSAALSQDRAGALGPLEVRVRHREGHCIWANLTWDFVTGPDGSPHYAVGTLRDISAWREALTAVEMSRERYRSLFSACPVALLECDASAVRDELDRLLHDGADDVRSYLLAHADLLEELIGNTHVLDANDAAVSLFRAESCDEVLGGLGAFFGPDACASFVGAVAALAQGRSRFEAELSARALDGQNLLARLTLSPAPGHEDNYLRVLAALTDVTQQRRNDETIRALLNAPSDVILLMDTRGVLLAVNDWAAERLGLPPDRLLGRCVYDVSSPEVAQCRQLMADQVARTGRATHYSEFRSDVIYDTTVYPLFGRAGRIERLAILARDITEDVARRKELEETQRTAAQIVGAIPSGLLVYDYEPPDRFRLAEANPAAESMTRISAAEDRGRLFRRIWPESYREGVTEAYVRVMRTGQSEDSEIPYQHPDGSLSHVFRARVFRLSERRLGVAFEDVTSERKAELALRASEATARALLNAPSESMILTDLDGRIVELNDAAARRLGLSREELIGKVPGDVVPEELARERVARLRQVAEIGEPLAYTDSRDG